MLSVHLLGHQSSLLSNEFSIHILYYFQSPTVQIHMHLTVNQALVLRPNCVSEKMGVNKKGVNQKCIPVRKNGVYRGHRRAWGSVVVKALRY